MPDKVQGKTKNAVFQGLFLRFEVQGIFPFVILVLFLGWTVDDLQNASPSMYKINEILTVKNKMQKYLLS